MQLAKRGSDAARKSIVALKVGPDPTEFWLSRNPTASHARDPEEGMLRAGSRVNGER